MQGMVFINHNPLWILKSKIKIPIKKQTKNTYSRNLLPVNQKKKIFSFIFCC